MISLEISCDGKLQYTIVKIPQVRQREWTFVAYIRLVLYVDYVYVATSI